MNNNLLWDKMKNSITYIRDNCSKEIIYYPDKIRSLLLDLSPEAKTEIKVFCNVLTEDSLIKQIELNKEINFDYVVSCLGSSLGLSTTWAEKCVILLFEYFEYKYENKENASNKEDEVSDQLCFSGRELNDDILFDVANDSSILKRIKLFLEDEDFENAILYAEKVLDSDPFSARAYLYELMARKKSKSLKDLVECGNISTNKLFAKAIQYADTDLREVLEVALSKAKKADAYRQKKVKSISKLKNTIISVSPYHIVGLSLDGSVWAFGTGENHEEEVISWKNITSVSAGTHFTIGLKADGHVITTSNTGYRNYSVYRSPFYLFDLSNWSDIVAVSSASHVVGLKRDGTVIAQGANSKGECNVYNWTDIIAIATGYEITLGLKADGTVVATGNNENGCCNIYSWKNIVDITVTNGCTIGLQKDGNLICTEGSDNRFGQCDITDWTDIVSIASSDCTVYGVKNDGTAISTRHNFNGESNVYKWNDVAVILPMGSQRTFSVKFNGTIDFVGASLDNEADLLTKKLFNSFDTWENEFESYKISALKNELEEKRIRDLKYNYRNQNLCQYCGGSFKGVFTKKCVNCGKEKDY